MDYKKAARELVSQMTLEEKVSQMMHSAAPVERLGIPAYNWWNEALHGIARSGTATVFPQAIALAATFDDALLYEVACAVSDEGRAKYRAYQEEGDRDIYKGLTFWSPNINIFRDPRWGRGHETYGEDPYLTARLGVNFIKGLQGEEKELPPTAHRQLKTAACAKHFAVHSGPEKGRQDFNAECNDYDFWNTYLPAFEAAVKEAGVEGVMGAYNRINGDPCCGSKRLLKDILRDKWEFDGYTVADFYAIRHLNDKHKVTENIVESCALAVNAGCNLDCGVFFGNCLNAVKEGLLSEEAVDEAVIQLFITRMRLGLLGGEEVPEYVNIPYEVIDCQKHKDLNLKASQNSIVMLKNDSTLPLAPEKIKTIGVIGPNADSRAALVGNYNGTASEYITVLEGITEQGKEHGFRVLYAEGCHLYKEKTSDLPLSHNREAEALAVVKNSDIILLCLGLDAGIEGEDGDAGNEFASGDKLNLNLPGQQHRLLEKVTKAAGSKPVILVNISGSAIALMWADKHVNAVLQGFYPGSLGGRAIADILFGKISPSGKLPVTFYKSDDDLPHFHDYSMDNRTYRYYKGEPLYPFGFGLSYCKFEISNVTVNQTQNEIILTVKNTGNIQACETVQIYASHPELKEIYSLIGFRKIELDAGESQCFSVPLDRNAFSRRDENGDLYKIGGKWKISVGFSQPDERSINLTGMKPVITELNV
ncbi:MAG: glycoside hydrolase family 3 C-terminal domain-containing protein [Promicromonosporaceae bacterium]|nr:glycoside hydrolase family 3 C-terminal domain-containing protein [Promicromonosporaceae bacterium]